MADLCCVYNVGATLKMNEANADTLIPKSIRGLDGRPIRSRIIPRGATNGGRKLTARFGPRLITVEADLHIVSPADPSKGMDPFTDMDGYLANLNALVKAWVDGLEALLNSTFTLNFTPTGLAAVNLTCTYGYEGAEFQTAGTMVEPTCTFGLVCETG